MVQLLQIVAGFLVQTAMGFHIPHARHHHPIYVQYFKDRLDSEARHRNATPSDCLEARGTAADVMEQEYVLDVDMSRRDMSKEYQAELQKSLQLVVPLAATISTPISYDEETGMAQTAVRAIVRHPIASIVDNHLVALSSTLVISLGAVHEFVDCIELEWAHHATSSTESLAVLSLGHVLHYGRETIRQLMEMEQKEEKGKRGHRGNC